MENILSKHTKRFCRDSFDDMFIHCALAGKAQYIISGDKDLLDLKNISNIIIIKPKNFLVMTQ
ncbi:MAG: putative toxin-antitoxin system toxin component, PIN family [Patescibacteria group bacterium]